VSLLAVSRAREEDFVSDLDGGHQHDGVSNIARTHVGDGLKVPGSTVMLLEQFRYMMNRGSELTGRDGLEAIRVDVANWELGECGIRRPRSTLIDQLGKCLEGKHDGFQVIRLGWKTATVKRQSAQICSKGGVSDVVLLYCVSRD